MEEAYITINNVLVNLINEIWELEEKAIITEEFGDLTNNDMHVIEAVGTGDGKNMSSIARKLNITVGSLTTAMNSLVNKKYVERHRSEEDRRVVFVKLTPKGVRAYRHHEDYHRQMTQAVVDKLDEKDKYAFFFGGNYGQVHIEAGGKNGRKLLVIKDSFANAFVPLALEQFDDIYMVDLRYYKGDMQSYLAEHDITDILVLYNISNFISDKNLYKLQ